VEKEGLVALYKELQIQDPLYASKISVNDQLRIIRALEAIFVTKIKFSDLHKHNTKPDWKWIFVQPDLTREQIYHNIETRVHEMIKYGLIDETKDIINKFGTSSPVFRTIGYRHVLDFFHNKYNLATMTEKLILDTKHYAKRQQTLFRSLLKDETIHSSTKITREDIL
ncbi:MAG: hypothetical protein ACRCTJ_06080, partial [Brevinema sp.]